MPIFRQSDVFEDELEDDESAYSDVKEAVEPEPVSAPEPQKPKSIKKPESEPEEVEEEEEEEKPKQKKKKQKKRSVATTKKLIVLGIGSTALIVVMVVTSIGMSVKRKAAAEAKRQEELYAEVAKSYTPLESDNTSETEPATEQQDVSTSGSSYTDKELRALRKWGYTASEISIAERDGLSAKDLVASAKEDREEAQKEALAAVSDTASDEYKNLLDKTWLGGEELDVSGFTSDLIYMPSERVENVDYVKCEPHNQQCFIKLMLDNGVPAFMYITPDRYNELPDTGNMVVDIQTVTAGDVEVITSISEQRVN